MEQHFYNQNFREENDSKLKNQSKKTFDIFYEELAKTRDSAREDSKEALEETKKLTDIMEKFYFSDKKDNHKMSKNFIDLAKTLDDNNKDFKSYFRSVAEHQTDLFNLGKNLIESNKDKGFLKEVYDNTYEKTKNDIRDLLSSSTNKDDVQRVFIDNKDTFENLGISGADLKEFTLAQEGNLLDIDKMVDAIEASGKLAIATSKRVEKEQQDNIETYQQMMSELGERQESFVNSFEEKGKSIFGGNEVGGVFGKFIGKGFKGLNPFRATEDNNGPIGGMLKKVNLATTNFIGGLLNGPDILVESTQRGIAKALSGNTAKKILPKEFYKEIKAAADLEIEKQNANTNKRKSTRQLIKGALKAGDDSSEFKTAYYASNREKELEKQKRILEVGRTEKEKNIISKVPSTIRSALNNSEKFMGSNSDARTEEQKEKMGDIDRVVTPKNSIEKVFGNIDEINKDDFQPTGIMMENPTEGFINAVSKASGVTKPEGFESNSDMSMVTDAVSKASGVTKPEGFESNSDMSMVTDAFNPNNPLNVLQTNNNKNPNLLNGLKINSVIDKIDKFIGDKLNNRKEDLERGERGERDQKESLKDSILNKLMNKFSSSNLLNGLKFNSVIDKIDKFIGDKLNNRKEDLDSDEKEQKGSLKDSILNKLMNKFSSSNESSVSGGEGDSKGEEGDSKGGEGDSKGGDGDSKGGGLLSTIFGTAGGGILRYLLKSGAGGIARLVTTVMSTVISGIVEAAPYILGALAVAGVVAIAVPGVRAAMTLNDRDNMIEETNKKTNDFIRDKYYKGMTEEESAKLKELEDASVEKEKNKISLVREFFSLNPENANRLAEAESRLADAKLAKYRRELGEKYKPLKDGDGIATMKNTNDMDKSQIKEDNKKKIESANRTAKNTEDMVKGIKALNNNFELMMNSSASDSLSSKV